MPLPIKTGISKNRYDAMSTSTCTIGSPNHAHDGVVWPLVCHAKAAGAGAGPGVTGSGNVLESATTVAPAISKAVRCTR